MCTCKTLLKELATIIAKKDPEIDRIYDLDGPYWARGFKKHVIVSLLAPKISSKNTGCNCPIAKRLKKISELAEQVKSLNPEGDMLERAGVDNAYAVVIALIGDSTSDKQLVAFMDAATQMTADKKGNGATGLKATR